MSVERSFIKARFSWLASLAILSLATLAMAAEVEQPRVRFTLNGSSGDLEGVAEAPVPHPRGDQIEQQIEEIGVAASDVYRIPLREIGAVATMIRFETPVDLRDPAASRQEAIRVFSATAHLIDARMTPFVLLKAMAPGAEIERSGAHDYVLWQDTAFNWRLISISPDEYFRTKIDRDSASSSPGDVAYWHLCLGAIERARGRAKRAVEHFEAALSASRSLAEDPFLVRARSAWALAAMAAREGDHDALSRHCRQWALALGDRDVQASDYRPLYTEPAVYPFSASRRGLEGYVTAEFTVTEDGRIEDITIVESEPAGVFDAAAKKALSRYQYLPAVEDGELVSVPGVRHQLRFGIQ